MNPPATVVGSQLSEAGRARLLSAHGEPLFLAEWERALFFHFEIEAAILQREFPFELELRDGKTFVSLVAFTMRNLRLRVGGRIAAWLFRPIATHSFLNVRTYVKHHGEPGICFLTEWLSSRLSVALGPPIYGLPYRFAWIDYRHEHEKNHLRGEINAPRHTGRFAYEACLEPGNQFCPCEAGSVEEFLLERYTAFNWRGKSRRFFRVWHPPWPQTPARVSIEDDSLLTGAFPWFECARFVGANYSPGFHEVWMGRAQLCKS
jgi:uncharacterized protein